MMSASGNRGQGTLQVTAASHLRRNRITPQMYSTSRIIQQISFCGTDNRDCLVATTTQKHSTFFVLCGCLAEATLHKSCGIVHEERTFLIDFDLLPRLHAANTLQLHAILTLTIVLRINVLLYASTNTMNALTVSVISSFRSIICPI